MTAHRTDAARSSAKSCYSKLHTQQRQQHKDYSTDGL